MYSRRHHGTYTMVRKRLWRLHYLETHTKRFFAIAIQTLYMICFTHFGSFAPLCLSLEGTQGM